MKNLIRIQVRIFKVVLAAVFVLACEVMKANSYLPVDSWRFENRPFRISKNSNDTSGQGSTLPKPGECRKDSCGVFAEVDKSDQLMHVYVSGELLYSFAISSGKSGHETPDFDLRPSGPLYKKYTSTKYPEGDYQGLGNMPYAVFLRSGYAIHGTTPGRFKKLGTAASHGCIRLHPDDAKTFYELVSSVGVKNTWVTVHD